MRKPTMSFQEIKRALATQDEQLAAAYAAVETGRPVPVDLSTLHALAETCTPISPHAPEIVRKGNAVRC